MAKIIRLNPLGHGCKVTIWACARVAQNIPEQFVAGLLWSISRNNKCLLDNF